MEHFAQGKRHLLVNDINAAVNSLQEACRMLAEKHGETAPECGDAYFYYGRALLEMARMESDVLGNALDGVPEGDDLENSQVENPDKLSEEEKEKVSDQVDEALQETTKSLTKDKKSSPSKDGDKKASPSKDEDKKEKSDEPMKDGDKAEKKEGEDVEEKDGEKTEEDEDVSNHQLAWEMLELAKVIYQRQEEGNKDMSLKTAQVFLKLGEVGLESENYPQSIEDFQSCLKIQETHMEKDDRCLAETHYQLGVAHSFSDQFDESIESFTKALKIIKDKIQTLEKSEEDKETKESEVKELNNLLPEIKEKIEDMEEMKKDATEKINKVKKELGMASAIGGSVSKEVESSTNAFGSSTSTATADAKPIQTSMIRKKRKPEDDAEEDSAKKTKAENGEAKPSENGSKKSSPAKNGDAKDEKMDTEKDNISELKKTAAVDMEKKTKEIKDSA